MSHDAPAPVDNTPHHHIEKTVVPEHHQLQPQDAAKLSLEAQMHLKESSNLWVRGNADDTAGSAAPKAGGDHKGGAKPIEYNDLKQSAANAETGVQVHGDNLKTFKVQNDRMEADISHQAKDNSNLSHDVGNVLDVHDKYHKGSVYGADKKELEEMAKMPKQLVTDEQKASINRVLKDWDKIDDLKTSGPIKLLDRDSAKTGFDNRQQEVQKETDGLDKNRVLEHRLDRSLAFREKVAKNAELDITPIQDVLNASKVQKGDNYYQVAERMLATDHNKHTGKEIQNLGNVLKDEMAAEGHSAKRGDQLVTQENFDRVMQKIRGTDVPSLPVPNLEVPKL